MMECPFFVRRIGRWRQKAAELIFETENVNISRRLFGHAAIGMFHNLNDYATFVTTIVPFAVYRLINAKSLAAKIYCGFLSLASLYLIVLSESRGAILTLIALVCMGLYVFAKKSSRNKLLVLSCIFVFIIAILVNIAGIRTVIFNLILRNSINLSGNSDIARMNLIKNGLYFLKRTYGFGVGAGNLYNWLANESIYYIGGLRFIHNWYVEVLVTFGVLFFAIYLIFHCRLLYTLYPNKRSFSSLKNTFFLSFICFSIVSVSSSSNVYSEWVWMYLVIVSIYSATIRYERSFPSMQSML